MPSVLIEIDSREQKPLLFPKTLKIWKGHVSSVYTISVQEGVTLPAGDYRLAAHPRAGICERKRDINELHQNLLTSDRTRFLKAITRLQDACTFPFFFLETPPTSLLRAPTHTPNPKPGKVFDAFYRLALERRIPCLYHSVRDTKSKLVAGTMVARMLIVASLPRDDQ